MSTAWKWVQKICYTVKTLSYGQQAAFLSKDWMLTVSSNDVKMPKEKETEKQLKNALKKKWSAEVTRSVEKQGAEIVKFC